MRKPRLRRCAVCGERGSIDGYTRDNRVILTCGDAAPPDQVYPWRKLPRLHPDCRGAYRSDRRAGIVYPIVTRWAQIINHECWYCAKPL